MICDEHCHPQGQSSREGDVVVHDHLHWRPVGPVPGLPEVTNDNDDNDDADSSPREGSEE